MLRLALPHVKLNFDHAIAYPEVIRPTQAVPEEPVYDWMIELFGRDPSSELVKEKLGERGWKRKAFENYKAYLLSEYGTLEPKALYSKWFYIDKSLPVWDRTSDTDTSPIGWFDTSTETFRRGGQENLLHEDKPETRELLQSDPKPEVSLVSAWLRRQCRFG
jgi:hypothetical protein